MNHARETVKGDVELAVRKVKGILELVDAVDLLLFEVRCDTGGGHREVVVRDLGEEEVVSHVSVGDVVVQGVDAPPEAPVHRLKRR